MPPTPTQPACLSKRLRAGDRALFFVRDHAVTVNEAHAALIGGTLAFFCAERGMASRTIIHEPHYTLSAAVVGYAIGRLVRPER
jgi:hypothetical protein